MAMRARDVPASSAASRRSSSCTSRISSSAGVRGSPGYRVVVDPAADVFHEYEYGRNPRKSYFLERNRLVFVLSAYSARAASAPARLRCSSDRARHGGARGQGALAAGQARRLGVGRGDMLGRSRGDRRSTQALRRVRDRELARYLTPTFSPAMTPCRRSCEPRTRSSASYWRLVRRAALTRISVTSSPGSRALPRAEERRRLANVRSAASTSPRSGAKLQAFAADLHEALGARARAGTSIRRS